MAVAFVDRHDIAGEIPHRSSFNARGDSFYIRCVGQLKRLEELAVCGVVGFGLYRRTSKRIQLLLQFSVFCFEFVVLEQ